MQKIGYPTKSPDVRNASMLQEYYKAVNISRTGFFHNLISIAEVSSHREWSALGKPTDRDKWGMTVPTVNVSRRPMLSSCFIGSIHPPVHHCMVVFFFDEQK